MYQYFLLNNFKELKNFAEAYLPLVRVVLKSFTISPTKEGLEGDHFGIIAPPKDFDASHQAISNYANLLRSGEIKGRRNNIYRLHKPIIVGEFTIPRIEIFEYTPQENDRFLKYGFDHVALRVNSFDDFLSQQQEKGVPIERIVDGYHLGSKFFKTKTINNVMIEFRNDFLGKEDS